MNILKNIKGRTLWIITAVLFVVVIGIIVLLRFVPQEYTTTLTIIMIVGFILITILVQWAAFKSFKFKPKKEPTIVKEYNTELNIQEVLVKNKYKERKRNYGVSYLKIDRPNAFKVTLVTNSEAYFNPDDRETTEGDKELDKCDRMIAFEIFLDYKEEDIEKMVDYSIQGTNIYYTAFYQKEDGTYICPNYIEPKEAHNINYDRLMKELGLIIKENIAE